MQSLAFNFLDKSKVPNAEAIIKALQDRLDELDFEGIIVDSVEVDIDGTIYVTFVDEDGDVMDVIFLYDDEEGAVALIDDEDGDDEMLAIDLDALQQALVKTVFGHYINLTELDWMNKSLLHTLFQAGDLDRLEGEEQPNEVTKGKAYADPYGYIDTNEDYENDTFEISERKVFVVRGGKRVKLAVVRKVKRKILSGKRKAAIRSAARKRKTKKHLIARKRKKSLKIRKRMGIKKVKLSKLQKVAGTANRKR